ncbi:FliM/FliN family flagellar motor switch protein [Microbulbifer sp. ALW1]|uniref:FliM/FliN family flagellar motor switch protein n=1 Tax=Microbulbifer sp. (strain ALW1) TaxID=1516059 RepID=UPI0013588813|nr:FliM/FliN family flagellar motor C-terminal domain-containing protein [Microbulbifer sp. ALW1]
MSEVVLEDISNLDESVKGKAISGNFDKILNNVQVELEVVVGSVKVELGKLVNGKVGNVITLDQAIGDPVVLKCDGLEVGRGILVASGANLAVKVIESD